MISLVKEHSHVDCFFSSDHGETISLCGGVPAKLDQRAAAQTQAPAGQMLPEMQGQ